MGHCTNTNQLDEDDALSKLQDKIKGDPSLGKFYLTLFHEDDKTLLHHFLRNRNKDLDKAFKSLQNCIYAWTVKYSHLTLSIDLSFTPFLDKGGFRLLKHRDQNGRHVLLLRTRLWNPDIQSIDQIGVEILLFADEMLRTYPSLSDHGVVIISDTIGCTLRQILHLTPIKVYDAVNLFMFNLPVKYKTFHIVSQGFLWDKIITLMKAFLKEKMRQRILSHTKNESLHEYLSPSILPKSLGGDMEEDEAYDESILNQLRTRQEHYDKLKAFIKGGKNS